MLYVVRPISTAFCRHPENECALNQTTKKPKTCQATIIITTMAANNSDDGDSVHALAPFLEERLPALGLDCETYGSYILPLLTDTTAADDDDEAGDADAEEEEWDSVFELLRASSETHGDDDRAWTELRRDIQAAWRRHRDDLAEAEAARHAERERALREQLEREVEEIARQVEEKKAGIMQMQQHAGGSQTTDPSSSSSGDADAAAKRALLNRFAYEDPDAEGDGKKEADPELPAPVTNREAAQQLQQQHRQELRAHKHGSSTTTKREEQQKTAEARKSKQQLKEERRKRAAKGERRR